MNIHTYIHMCVCEVHNNNNCNTVHNESYVSCECMLLRFVGYTNWFDLFIRKRDINST